MPNFNPYQNLVDAGLAPPTEGAPAKQVTPMPYEYIAPASTDTTFFIKPDWYDEMAWACTAKDPQAHGCMMFGPMGSGKSTAIRKLMKDCGITPVVMQCSANMQIDSLIGTWVAENGTMRFVYGPLSIAMRDDVPMIAEEGNAVHPGIWSATNTLTDQTGEGLRLPTGEVIENKGGFRLILLFNDGPQYSGLREVNMAMKRRLPPILCSYPSKEAEMLMVRHYTGIDKALAEDVVDMGRMIRANDVGLDLSADILCRFVKMTYAVYRNWSVGFDRAIVNLLGSPETTLAERGTLQNIANNTVRNWKFVPPTQPIREVQEVK